MSVIFFFFNFFFIFRYGNTLDINKPLATAVFVVTTNAPTSLPTGSPSHFSLMKVKKVSAGDHFTCVLFDHIHEVTCFGEGRYGMLGTGGTADKYGPTYTTEDYVDVGARVVFFFF